KIVERLIFPNYTLAQQVHITDFLDRIDIFLISIWLPVYIIKIVVTVMALNVLISHYASMKAPNILGKWLVWVLLSTQLAAYDSMRDILDFSNYGLSLITIGFIFPFFLIIYFAGYLRKRKVKLKRRNYHRPNWFLI